MIDENSSAQSKKQNLVSILLKHKKELGLSRLDEKLKYQEKVEAKQKEYRNRKNELNDFGFRSNGSPTRIGNTNWEPYDFNQIHSHRQFDSEKSKEHSKRANNV